VNIHEYQAKEIFRSHGIPIPPGGVATTPAEAEGLARRYASTVVVKAQVHVGGRGKAGGVKLAKTPEETREVASKILGMQIKGLTVHKVLVTPAAEIATEAYVGIIVDRASKRPVFMVSPAGGIDIEEVAAKTPDKIMRLPVDPVYGLLPFQALQMGLFLYADIKQARAAAKIMQQLYAAFWASGASLAEINPLVTTPTGDVVALDAKMVIDDNELDRRPELALLRDETAEDPAEVRAREAGLTFIKLDGNVGCVVNGAGLAMATMDIIQYAGGSPANFLDVGGGANAEQIRNAFHILLSDAHVRAVLINIFGGILRCDTLATGVVAAARELKVRVPIVVRMEGTNVEEGRRILNDSGLDFTVADGMKDAAEKVVRLAA
jgi:succinyl-CoA synthetase beta subunit